MIDLAPFIEIRDLTVRFGDVVALRNVNLVIEEGESVGILGRSGCGKSVLMHVLRGVGVISRHERERDISCGQM